MVGPKTLESNMIKWKLERVVVNKQKLGDTEVMHKYAKSLMGLYRKKKSFLRQQVMGFDKGIDNKF